jgi:hypothetical protein
MTKTAVHYRFSEYKGLQAGKPTSWNLNKLEWEAFSGSVPEGEVVKYRQVGTDNCWYFKVPPVGGTIDLYHVSSFPVRLEMGKQVYDVIERSLYRMETGVGDCPGSRTQYRRVQ